MNILVIDDEESDLILIEMILRRHDPGLMITTGRSCEDAKKFNAGMDLIIIDQNLLHSKGLDCIREIRAGGYRGAMLLLTGAPYDGLAVEATRYGADGFMSKEGMFDQLSDAALKAMERRRESVESTIAEQQVKEKAEELKDNLSKITDKTEKGEKGDDSGG